MPSPTLFRGLKNDSFLMLQKPQNEQHHIMNDGQKVVCGSKCACYELLQQLPVQNIIQPNAHMHMRTV